MPLCAHHVVLCIVSWAFSPPLLWCLHPSHSLRSSPPVHTWETQVKSGHLQVRTFIGIKWSEKNDRRYHLWIILFDMFFHRQSTPVWLKWLRRSYPQVRTLILTLWVIPWKALVCESIYLFFCHFRNAGGLIMAPLCPLGWGYKRRGEHSNVHFV